MVLKIIIADRNNVKEIIKDQEDHFAVIGISDPFPDPVDYNTTGWRFRGLFKIEFEDSDPSINHDNDMLFNEKKCMSIIMFARSMTVNDVRTLIIHCDRGLHRSVAVAVKLRDIFTGEGYSVVMVNLPDNPAPNRFVMSVFDRV